ncbi:carboxylating nicotinate-nucleotide diphosphorylase [Candidatus Bathyarchaeota archaeon]|nr:carboxylating nicotinate-nucleotide diphosphorylase [Candidatus Bathyarchaeota archaeon]
MNEEKIKEFLKEDIGYGDITTEALILKDINGSAKLFFREPGIIAGLEEVITLFKILGCKTKKYANDGDKVSANKTILEVEGQVKALLAGERTALNLISHMSGIATKTAELDKKIKQINPQIKISATRKTLPGLREIEKKSVELGGGDPHRIRLDDCILIKDNHLQIISSITEALKIVRKNTSFTKKIEIEVESLEAAKEAAEKGADIIMLDNMNPDQIKKCLIKLDDLGLRKNVIFEASGGITSDNILDYASTGVDIISLGSLTHSSKALDVKLEIKLVEG